MGANGAIGPNRANIYARMYQAAGEKWAKAGVSSHAVCLYAHDNKVQEQFFRYGFGMRTVDAIRGMEEIETAACKGYDFTEINTNEFLQILPLHHLLDAHMAASPCFIMRPSDTEESFIQNTAHYDSIFFVARYEGEIVAYIRAELDGETFICDLPGYLHVKGAFCLPEHRRKGVYQNLLNLLIKKLKAENYTRLGVDFESINPAAYGFWLKYFNAYTHGVVRRIDEHILLNMKK
jgi:GNAT superfamily N-acetyltransferase